MVKALSWDEVYVAASRGVAGTGGGFMAGGGKFGGRRVATVRRTIGVDALAALVNRGDVHGLTASVRVFGAGATGQGKRGLVIEERLPGMAEPRVYEFDVVAQGDFAIRRAVAFVVERHRAGERERRERERLAQGRI